MAEFADALTTAWAKLTATPGPVKLTPEEAQAMRLEAVRQENFTNLSLNQRHRAYAHRKPHHSVQGLRHPLRLLRRLFSRSLLQEVDGRRRELRFGAGHKDGHCCLAVHLGYLVDIR